MANLIDSIENTEDITLTLDYDNRSIGSGLSLFLECVDDDTGEVRWRKPVTFSYDLPATCGTCTRHNDCPVEDAGMQWYVRPEGSMLAFSCNRHVTVAP